MTLLTGGAVSQPRFFSRQVVRVIAGIGASSLRSSLRTNCPPPSPILPQPIHSQARGASDDCITDHGNKFIVLFPTVISWQVSAMTALNRDIDAFLSAFSSYSCRVILYPLHSCRPVDAAPWVGSREALLGREEGSGASLSLYGTPIFTGYNYFSLR